jgi:FtsZ-interacting cell division protein YlmF
MQTSLVVLEYLRTLVWPTAVLVLAVVFRADLRQLAARMKKVEALGAAAEFERALTEAGVDQWSVPQEPASPPRHVEVTTYTDVRQVWEAYREGPVVVDVSPAPDSEAKRTVDFMAGMILARGGAIERLRSRTFLLVPPPVSRPPSQQR